MIEISHFYANHPSSQLARYELPATQLHPLLPRFSFQTLC
jgi:hypothetical protein